MIPDPYMAYAICLAVGFFFGLAAGLRWPLSKIDSCDAGSGRPEDIDLATPAPVWAVEKMAMLRKRGDRAEKELARMKKEGGK
jgi:hypothetical protein